MSLLTHLNLFSGIGGFELGIKLANANIKTTQFVEINPYAQKVLQFHFPNAAIHGDIKTFTPCEKFDLITISFPCKGTTLAGTKTGLDHPESALWYQSLRCVVIAKPKYIIVENPTGLITNGLEKVSGGLRSCGYSHQDIQIVSAEELGAPHQRKRVFIVAYANNLLRHGQKPPQWTKHIGDDIKQARGDHREAKPGGRWVVNGFSSWLAGCNIDGWWRENSPPANAGVTNTSSAKIRREMINLYGRAVTPQQAAIAIKRVVFLENFFNNE